MGKKMAKDEFDGMGATSKRDTWRPPKNLKKHKCEDKVKNLKKIFFYKCLLLDV